MEMYTVTQWLLFFYIYCFLGWVWESAYVSVKKRRFVNRGFLRGPFLPLYGSGALCVLIVTIPVRGNIVLMFLVGMVSATLLEYVTGAVMERLFRVRYWDYSDKFMNVNGYICLGSTVCWGVMTILAVDGFQPLVERLVFAIDEAYVTGIVLIITPLVTADFVTSFHAAIRLRDILIQNERIREELAKLTEKKNELEQKIRETGERAKEQVVQVKDQAVQAMEQVAQVKDQALGQVAQAKDQALGQVAQAKDQAMEQAAQVREQTIQEMQELLLKMGELKGRLSIPYGRTIRDLLRRNPEAVSHRHRETFADLKQTLLEKISRK